MKIKIWGARGSIPSPLTPKSVEKKICQAIFGMPDIDTNDMEAVRTYVGTLPPLQRGTAGGNTTCVEVQADSQTFIIDAGSGIRELGQELMKGPCGRGQGILHLFFTHAHWDHVQGFPFFVPAFIPGNRIFIYSVHNLEQALDDQQRPINFPVPLSIMAADLQFKSIQEGQSLHLGNVKIDSCRNAHPGDSYSFRFEDKHSIFVHASDSEYKQLNDASVQPHIDFFRNADALIFDAQYTLKEAWQKVDWGHSSAMIGVDLARAAGVKRLLLFHHDPTYSDHQLQDIQKTATTYQAQDTTLPTCNVMIAYEGLTLDLAPAGAIDVQMLPGQEAAIVTPATVFDERGADNLIQQLAQSSPTSSSANSIIDLSQVETLTTASLKSIIEYQTTFDRAQIVLAKPSREVQEIIRLSGYSDFFAIYPTIEAALAALQAREALNLPGQMLKGRYRIEHKIREGRLGTILKATDTHQNQPVALRVLPPTLSLETVSKFLLEARRITNLHHDNILLVKAIEAEGEHIFIVEEFLPMQNLRDRLGHASDALSMDECLNLASSIITALEHAHSRGIIHGCLKPERIFLLDNKVKLNGFGLGRLAGERNLLASPKNILSAPYLAPEQILGETLDARTDLYALGVVLYEMFTHQLPFNGSDAEIMEAHLNSQPRPPRQLNSEISHALEHLIVKLLAKNPNDRYASVRQARRIFGSLVVNSGEAVDQRRIAPVGRQRELATLQACWENVQNSQGQLAFVSGESGIGKSALVHQVAASCAPPVLLIRPCTELAESAAYHPFAEALRAYFATVPPEFMDQRVHPYLANLSRLIPEIRQMLPDLPDSPPLEPEQEQLRLMASITQFIKLAAANRPWLLILENLQWADAGSLQLLRYLGRHLPTIPLFILGTYRDSEIERNHPLHQTLLDLYSHPTYQDVALGRLGQTDVGQMLTNIWERPVPLPVIEKIYQHTGGNPFYVEEVAKGMVDDGLIGPHQSDWDLPALEAFQLPQSVQDTIWRRIHHLNSGAQMLLRQAAVLGPNFRFEDLRNLSGLSDWEVLEYLNIALERQLIQEVPGEKTLRFSQAEIQVIIYQALGPLRRRMLHRQAGEILEARSHPKPERMIEELAYHFYQAREYQKAFTYSFQAARQAQSAYSIESALHWFNCALEMLNHLDANQESQSQIPLIQEYRDEVLALLDRFDEALHHFTAAQSLLEVQPD